MGALRGRNFRLFWLGQLVSVTGSAMQSIGQAWLVLELTGSAWQLGLVGALQAAPILLFTLVGGIAADRWPRRPLLLATATAAALQALTLWALVVTGSVELWHLYGLALLLGLTSCLDRPVRQAFVVELVGRADLPNAVALITFIGSLARVVGPGLGGLLIAASGVGPLFLLNALSYLAALAGLRLIRADELHAPPRHRDRTDRGQGAWASLHEGLVYVWTTPAVRLVLVVAGLVLLFGSNFNVVLPLFATQVLGAGPEGFGLLSAGVGAGSVLAALWLAWSNRPPAIRDVLVATLVFGALEAALALSTSLPVALVLIVGVGFAEIAFATLAMTTLQRTAPDHLRGRVMSVAILAFDGSLPLGYLLTGWLATVWGPSLGLLACALLCLVVAGAGWLGRAPAERHLAGA